MAREYKKRRNRKFILEEETSEKTERQFAKKEVLQALEDNDVVGHYNLTNYEVNVPEPKPLSVRYSFSAFLADFKARLGL